MSDPGETGRVLLTGATGYVGGRLRRRLEARGVPVRCLARRPEVLAGKVGSGTEVLRGDVLDAASLAPACDGASDAYYLVHSMGASRFESRDRRGAKNFAAAARAAGVRRIVYLGGLGSDDDELSPHLRSRNEVGEILRASGVPTVELRASIVLGSGSLSFEMIRALVEKLPVMVTPSWVRVLAQPIAIDDLLDYLVEALDIPLDESRVFEIGGADQVSYGDLMKEYARQRGMRRVMVPVPVLTPYVSSLWLGLVTPLYARIGKKLIQSMPAPDRRTGRLRHAGVPGTPSRHAGGDRERAPQRGARVRGDPVVRRGVEQRRATGWALDRALSQPAARLANHARRRAAHTRLSAHPRDRR